MKTNKLTVAILMVVALLIVSATAVLAQPALAEFTIENNSDHTVYITMFEATELRHSAQNIEYPAVPGGAFYYVIVQPNTTKTVTVKRALFSVTTIVCSGKSITNALDLSLGGLLRIPSTCTTYYDTYQEVGTLDDVMEANTLIAFNVANTGGDTIFVSMVGPQVHNFSLGGFQTVGYTLSEGTYNYSYQCKGQTEYYVKTGSWKIAFHQTLELGCP